VIGKVQDGQASIEVCVWAAARIQTDGVVYVTKYHGQQVGERTVGMSKEAARAIALLLSEASNR
jgi:hypothetical protein